MKPLAEWTTDELRELHLDPAYLGYTAEETLDELLRRERASLAAEVCGKYRADMDLIVEATKLLERERCAMAVLRDVAAAEGEGGTAHVASWREAAADRIRELS